MTGAPSDGRESWVCPHGSGFMLLSCLPRQLGFSSYRAYVFLAFLPWSRAARIPPALAASCSFSPEEHSVG